MPAADVLGSFASTRTACRGVARVGQVGRGGTPATEAAVEELVSWISDRSDKY